MDIAEFFKTHRNDHLWLITHSQADADSIASAIALHEFFPNSQIIIPDIMNAGGKRLCQKFACPYQKFSPSLKPPTAIIILDTNSASLLPGIAPWLPSSPGDIAIIDHHPLHRDAVKAHALHIDPSASSTSEVIYSLLSQLGHHLSSSSAEALLIGILADSAGFRSATANTLTLTVELLRSSRLSLSQLYSLAEPPMNFGERLSLLRAFEHVRIFRAGDFLLVATTAPSYEAVAAARLVELGADFALVAQKTQTEIRLSARCLSSYPETFGINLGEAMGAAGEALGGSGGGHSAAAGADGPKLDNLEEAKNSALEAILDQLKKAGAISEKEKWSEVA